MYGHSMAGHNVFNTNVPDQPSGDASQGNNKMQHWNPGLPDSRQALGAGNGEGGNRQQSDSTSFGDLMLGISSQDNPSSGVVKPSRGGNSGDPMMRGMGFTDSSSNGSGVNPDIDSISDSRGRKQHPDPMSDAELMKPLSEHARKLKPDASSWLSSGLPQALPDSMPYGPGSSWNNQSAQKRASSVEKTTHTTSTKNTSSQDNSSNFKNTVMSSVHASDTSSNQRQPASSVRNTNSSSAQSAPTGSHLPSAPPTKTKAKASSSSSRSNKKATGDNRDTLSHSPNLGANSGRHEDESIASMIGESMRNLTKIPGDLDELDMDSITGLSAGSSMPREPAVSSVSALGTSPVPASASRPMPSATSPFDKINPLGFADPKPNDYYSGLDLPSPKGSAFMGVAPHPAAAAPAHPLNNMLPPYTAAGFPWTSSPGMWSSPLPTYGGGFDHAMAQPSPYPQPLKQEYHPPPPYGTAPVGHSWGAPPQATPPAMPYQGGMGSYMSGYPQQPPYTQQPFMSQLMPQYPSWGYPPTMGGQHPPGHMPPPP